MKDRGKDSGGCIGLPGESLAASRLPCFSRSHKGEEGLSTRYTSMSDL